MKGMSHCEADCAKAWPPFLADAKAKPAGDWSLVVREGGAHQWAYKDKPLYAFPADKPGQAGNGETAGKFKLAK
jgi:predicted lipoprotein with Yx(FWY)xxD motif